MEERAIQQLKVILERQGAKIDSVETLETTDRLVALKMGDYTVIVYRKSKISEKDITAALGEESGDGPKGRPNLIAIMLTKPSEAVENTIRDNIAKKLIGNYFHLRELQIDITQHRMFPPHFLFNDAFKKANPKVAEQFNTFRMKDPDVELPRMDCLDIGARLVGAHPGDIVYIQRHSDTVGYAPMFRRVVINANVEQ
jgi:DNA-directed RNA polymerase subunit H (RpoH/RPB5)